MNVWLILLCVALSIPSLLLGVGAGTYLAKMIRHKPFDLGAFFFGIGFYILLWLTIYYFLWKDGYHMLAGVITAIVMWPSFALRLKGELSGRKENNKKGP